MLFDSLLHYCCYMKRTMPVFIPNTEQKHTYMDAVNVQFTWIFQCTVFPMCLLKAKR